MANYLTITPEDIRGDFEYTVDIKDTVPMCTCDPDKSEEDCDCYYCKQGRCVSVRGIYEHTTTESS